jgi:hypothetical protein
MVANSSYRFFLNNWKLGLESAHQNELIGTIFMPCALNLNLNDFFRGAFLKNSFSGLFKLKYAFNKIC